MIEIAEVGSSENVEERDGECDAVAEHVDEEDFDGVTEPLGDVNDIDEEIVWVKVSDLESDSERVVDPE